MEVQPFELRVVARSLAHDSASVQRRLRRCEHETEAVALHPADPALGGDLPVRQARVVAALQRWAAGLASVADELASAADDALTADAGGGFLGGAWTGELPLICRLPGDTRSSLDRWLTDTVGSGLEAVSTGAVLVADLLDPSGDRSVSGDAGGTYTTRSVPFAVPAPASFGDGSVTAARVVVGALDATTDQTVLAHDEFGLVDHGLNRYTVVLPGVTDLSRPERGWNPVHRSARDLDMAALPSSRSTDVDHNVYAQAVAAGLSAVELPVGAELLIVGHSFGADTAIDLATDPTFTARYDVTHVVATGYFSQPQLRSVSPETNLLVLRNRRDVVVHLGSGMPTVEGGVLRCGWTGSGGVRNPAVVRFDGGSADFGHSVDAYRSVFTGQAHLDAETAAVVGHFLDSINRTSGPPDSMLAIDISLEP